MPACLVRAVISTLAAALLVSGCDLPGWEKRPFPEKIRFSRVIASCQSLGIREGSVAAYLELAPETVEAIKKEGFDFFHGETQARGDNDLKPWRQTPLAQAEIGQFQDESGRSIYAWPMNDCGGRDIVSVEASQMYDALLDTGAFYTTFNHNEGLLVVAPNLELAGFFYFG